jgi:hypothetical protein
MKRTPLKRKTPLRKVSKKRAALKRLMDPKRTAFVLDAGACMICKSAAAIDCHEICRGPAREAALSHPRLWIACCRYCHELMGDYSDWPIVRQVAARIDWEIRRTLAEVNEVRGRAEDAIVPAEIVSELI